MVGAFRLGFDPALPLWAIMTLGVIAFSAWGVYLWRGGGAPLSRALGVAFLLLGLMQPQWVREAREPAEDIALVLVDQSESLGLAGRRDAARALGDSVAQRLSEEQGLEVRVRETRGGPDGTFVPSVASEALADVARDRIAGVIVITEGQAADPPEDPRAGADIGPVHVLIVGDPERGDRRLELLSAPTFGIVGERMEIRARIHDPAARGSAQVRVSIDGAPALARQAPLNQDFTLNIALAKRGRNMVIIDAEQGPQEISPANNRAAFAANGVRDRLRVLLITGEPHQGARVWRNLLKSDPAVDLVHFSILRPPEKQDFTPTAELALIPFPTEELFERRLDEFDLIIFDRYRQRGILQPYYYSNIARRVEQGGALLISAGDAEAGPQAVYRTTLSAILPSQPTGQVIERPYRPQPTTLGQRHPVLRGIERPEQWGRWTRQIDARASGGQTILSGDSGRPLIVLDRAGRGRVAQVWSDQMWLWARGYDGGGPYAEMMRRLAHWLMQEPELEDERLRLDPSAHGLSITRGTLSNSAAPVELIAPSGARSTVELAQNAPGLWRAETPAPEQGLYEARAGALRAFAAIGPLNPREAAAINADPDILAPWAEASGGGVHLTGEDGSDAPEIRRIGRNDRAFGDNWIGLRNNGAYVVRAAVSSPLGPGWAWALAGLALLMLGWRREAR